MWQLCDSNANCKWPRVAAILPGLKQGQLRRISSVNEAEAGGVAVAVAAAAMTTAEMAEAQFHFRNPLLNIQALQKRIHLYKIFV